MLVKSRDILLKKYFKRSKLYDHLKNKELTLTHHNLAEVRIRVRLCGGGLQVVLSKQRVLTA